MRITLAKSCGTPICLGKYIKRSKSRKVNKEVEVLPVPRVKKGKWSKERERTKSGRWRKKRSDADQPKKPKRSIRKYVLAIAIIVATATALAVFYLLFPELFNWIKI